MLARTTLSRILLSNFLRRIYANDVASSIMIVATNATANMPHGKGGGSCGPISAYATLEKMARRSINTAVFFMS